MSMPITGVMPKEEKMLTQADLLKKLKYHSGPTKMPKTKIARLLSEFGCISKHVKGSIAQIFVSVAEKSLFRYRPLMNDIGDELAESPIWIEEELFFLDKKGRVVTAKKKVIVKEKRFFGLWGRVVAKEKINKIVGIVRPQTTVYKVFKKLGEKANRIYRIVSYCRYTQAVVVYKFPKNVSMLQWRRSVLQQKAKSQNELKGAAA